MIGGSLMSSLCLGYQLQMLGELLARMAQFVHGFQYPCPLAVPSHIDSGLSLVTCFGQWDNSIYDMSRNLKSACALGLVLLVLLKCCHQAQASLLEDRHHVEENGQPASLQSAWQLITATCASPNQGQPG